MSDSRVQGLSTAVRVSVIVPVFQPGEAFDELIASLDRQTLPATDFEVILCDDGSGEPTQARLAEVARNRPSIRVLDLPRTGWPGTPRNHGIAAAAGEYVYFVDQDDYLFDRALERLCDFADLHGSDVIVGKEVGIGRALPRKIFRRDVPHAELGKDPLLELLTPHKMFRTSFLREHGVRFPDGRVRLEDHLFVMQAYFAARTISILASEPCYAWVKQPGSASSSRIDPDTYFPHLASVFDLVEANTEPGALRDRLLRHWFRGKILKRLSGRQMLRYPADYRARFLDVVTPLVRERLGPGVDRGLGFPHRVRAALVRADRRDDLVRLAEFETNLECVAEVTSATWSRGGGLRIRLRVHVTHDGDEVLVLEPSGGDDGPGRWMPPASLGGLPDTVLDAARDLRSDGVELALQEKSDGRERRLAGRRPEKSGSVEVAVDPLRVFGRDDPSRGGRIVARVRRAGWSFDVPLVADAAVLAAVGPSPVLAGRPVTLVRADDGTVELRRTWPAGGWKDTAGRLLRRGRALLRRR
jgi:glycosyltransferase involved in cell wall biosynthesis